MPLDPDLTEFSTVSPVLVNYNYTDIDEGTGTKLYYVSTCYNVTSGTANILLTQQIFAKDIEFSIENVNVEGDAAIFADEDYDLTPFNIVKTLFGNAYLTITHSNKRHSLVSGFNTGYSKFIIKKVSGGVPTIIGSAQVDGDGSGNVILEKQTIQIPLTKTHFKRGDILRLTIEAWGTATDTSPDHERFAFWGTDPGNRDGTKIVPSTDDPVTSTTTLLYIPSLLNV